MNEFPTIDGGREIKKVSLPANLITIQAVAPIRSGAEARNAPVAFRFRNRRLLTSYLFPNTHSHFLFDSTRLGRFMRDKMLTKCDLIIDVR